MRTTEYLEAVKSAAGIASDYALAKRLGVSHQAVSKYRNGGTFDTTTAARVAELLELDPLRVIADAEIERATRPDARALWERIAAKVAAGVLVAIGAGLVAPAPANAAQSAPASQGLCVMSTGRRAWWAALVPLLPPPPDDRLA